MKKRETLPRSFSKAVIVVVALLIILAGAFLVLTKVNGQSFGLKEMASTLKHNVLAVLDSQSIASYRKGSFTNVIFLHHSTGENLIAQGGVREGLTKAGFSFFDHDYNRIGMRDPAGNYKGYNYAVPYDNTDIDGLAAIFKQPEFPLPINTLSGLLQHEVIVLKSCFPNSDITSDEELEQIKGMYLGMRSVMDRHPEKIFILLTTPPLNPAETNLGIAARARKISAWLQSPDFLKDRRNIYVFDFYSLLAEESPNSAEYNMLKKAYRDGGDSHPNQAANAAIGPKLVSFISEAIQTYRDKK